MPRRNPDLLAVIAVATYLCLGNTQPVALALDPAVHGERIRLHIGMVVDPLRREARRVRFAIADEIRSAARELADNVRR